MKLAKNLHSAPKGQKLAPLKQFVLLYGSNCKFF